jgi:hypothetical protein
MAFYSFEKGKYGGYCGCIFPFFGTLTGLSSLGSDYLDYIPAGYLKCRGQILSADQYPNLAEVLGVGQTSIYKKPSSILQERNADGTGGTFQLPDLGSKYITANSTSGGYANTTSVNTATNLTVDRAGVEVTLESQGSSVDFFYSGNFNLPGRNITLTGNVVPVAPPSSTSETSPTIGEFLGHGHNSTMKIARRINTRNEAVSSVSIRRRGGILGLFCGDAGRTICRADADFGLEHKSIILEEEGSDTATKHKHFGVFPVKNSETKSASTKDVLISASPLTTTVNINTASVIKMDDIAPKFILCEYLIKY